MITNCLDVFLIAHHHHYLTLYFWILLDSLGHICLLCSFDIASVVYGLYCDLDPEWTNICLLLRSVTDAY